MLASTSKKMKMVAETCKIRDNVLVAVDNVDRSKLDGRNVVAMITDINQDTGGFKLQTKTGNLLNGEWFGNQLRKSDFNHIRPSTANQTEQSNEISLREAVKETSLVGGQGMSHCKCITGCKTSFCICRRKKLYCTSSCHKQSSCSNK